MQHSTVLAVQNPLQVHRRQFLDLGHRETVGLSPIFYTALKGFEAIAQSDVSEWTKSRTKGKACFWVGTCLLETVVKISRFLFFFLQYKLSRAPGVLRRLSDIDPRQSAALLSSFEAARGLLSECLAGMERTLHCRSLHDALASPVAFLPPF